ncbi:SirB1 family protein [Caldimonas tepidiphila]|uniref:SirB1 family protein n=1 Tax=Caldimonas tepidiphila TaxID=2315841 RepID=UPI000E5A604A|nr:tetratricopeptide repeat protein [Caldimonas tepidiphila]
MSYESSIIQKPTPLQHFALLVADDASFPLTEAAIAVAQDEYPELDVQGVLSEIDVLAQRLRGRLPVDAGPVQRLRALNRYFFQELGFGGNVNDYYDPHNSYLNVLLCTRRGIPISLAVLYMELAGQLRLDARGVSFPGHFLVKLKLPEGEAVIDPFTGVSLSREDLEERLRPYKRQQGLEGDFDVPLGLFLQAATPREIVARLLRNLKEIHRNDEDWPRLLAVLNRLVALLPGALEERRDRGLTYAELGQNELAIADLGAYVRQARRADDLHLMRQRLDELRSSGSTRRRH